MGYTFGSATELGHPRRSLRFDDSGLNRRDRRARRGKPDSKTRLPHRAPVPNSARAEAEVGCLRKDLFEVFAICA